METLRLAPSTHLHALSFEALGQHAAHADELWVPAGALAGPRPAPALKLVSAAA